MSEGGGSKTNLDKKNEEHKNENISNDKKEEQHANLETILGDQVDDGQNIDITSMDILDEKEKEMTKEKKDVDKTKQKEESLKKKEIEKENIFRRILVGESSRGSGT